MSEEKAKKPFYKKWWFILIVVGGVLAGISGQDGDGPSTASSGSSGSSSDGPSTAPSGSSGSSSKAPPKLATVGDWVETKYFKQRVTSASLTKASLCEYFCEAAPAGSQFLVVSLEIENTDTEGRQLFDDGTVYAVVDGKEYKFDDSETIMDDGWLMLDTINPLVTLRAKAAFKISDKFALTDMQYQFPRSRERIQLN